MNDIGVFSDWIAAGAAFGIKAFFALFVFALCCCAVLGLIGVLANAIGVTHESRRAD